MASLQEQARALGDPTRHEIFRYLFGADRPVDVAELTDHLALNHNAIRQHLVKLVGAGLVVEAARSSQRTRGRPRLRYQLAPAARGRWGGTAPYERLSLLLGEMVRTGEGPVEVGRRAGGQYRAVHPSSGDPVADVAAIMADHGFDPEVHRRSGGADLVLRACPFEAVARAEPGTICALHLGIAQGLVAGAGVVVDELAPNEPGRAHCRLRLLAGGGSGERLSG